MSDCKSSYTIVNDLWQSYGTYAKTALGIATSVLSSPPTGVAAVVAANKVEEMMSMAHDFWNQNVGKESWKKIGPRALQLASQQRGNVVLATARTFISEIPSHTEKVRLRVWEEGGKAKTTIKVCLVDSKGYHEEVASQTLNTTDAEKDHENQVFDKTLGNALGRYVVCIIDTTSVFSNFKYAIELNQA